MTKRWIIDNLDRILDLAEAEAMENRIDGDHDEYGNPIYEDGYGEASITVRLTQKQAEGIYDYLSENGYEYFGGGPILVNPKAVYRLSVSFVAATTRDRNDRWWSVYRLTESPYDTIEEGEDRPSLRRSRRERAAIIMP